MGVRGFVDTLHFRITILFLVLLAVVFLAYIWWVDREIYGIDYAPGEERWAEERQDAEQDSLALAVASTLGTPERLDGIFAAYEKRLLDYDAELSLMAPDGVLTATTMNDTLADLRIAVAPAILDSMTTDAWDFSSFPDPDHLDVFVNRITRVVPVHANGDTLAPPDGWLAATFRPLAYVEGELESDDRTRVFQGMAMVLVYSFLVGLILLTWVSRRIRNLSHDMAVFRRGDYDRRAAAGAGDEIARLGGDFNRLADRLNQVIGELKQSETYRNQLVANISHDLRTPMATLRGYVETFLLQWNRLSEEDRERQLTTITSNLDNLEDMIEQLFELTQIDSGRIEIREEVFPLEELAADAIERLRIKAEAKDVELTLHEGADLPLVQADPVRIGQVLQNLLDNAIKFHRPGGRVWVKTAVEEGRVAVSVFDDGDGIASEDLPHVFERFYTADKSRTAKGQGSGLGLAIAHSIVHAHGSELTVRSREGGGAVFLFSLPTATA